MTQGVIKFHDRDPALRASLTCNLSLACSRTALAGTDVR